MLQNAVRKHRSGGGKGSETGAWQGGEGRHLARLRARKYGLCNEETYVQWEGEGQADKDKLVLVEEKSFGKGEMLPNQATKEGADISCRSGEEAEAKANPPASQIVQTKLWSIWTVL